MFRSQRERDLFLSYQEKTVAKGRMHERKKSRRKSCSAVFAEGQRREEHDIIPPNQSKYFFFLF
jgi:hypothetical protein